ncbi:MAG: glycosyltransferase [Candidatus Bathyarchaeota archaeon]|nr:glycosyltransferase [Candidatus Bathyarchaeota archaeon]
MMQEFPLITVGIVVMNRDWIIGRMLASLQSQTYPHDRLFVLVVDGESTDKTVETARRILEKSDFSGYEIVVQKCSIPEGRNLCIKNMQGDLLLFWDSDVIMEPKAVSMLLEVMKKEKASIVTANATKISVNSVDEIDAKLNEAKTALHPDETCEAFAVGMGNTLISKEVFGKVTFDPELTIWEDGDFSIRAREQNFRMLANKKIEVFDVNMIKKTYSDIYIDMPLRSAMKGIRKKSRTEVLVYKNALPYLGVMNFFLRRKRYVFYLGYLPALLLSLIGVLAQNLMIALIFPVYLFSFAVWQFARRGLAKGAKALMRSLLVGFPNAFFIAYYFAKFGLIKSGSGTKKAASVC